MFGSTIFSHNLIDKKFTKSKIIYTNYYEQALHIDAFTGADNKYQGIMLFGGLILMMNIR